MPFSVSAEPVDPFSGPKDVLELLGYWEGKRRKGKLPSRHDIDPLELRHFLGDLSLLDVRRDPLDFVYRLVGTKLAHDASRNLTGKSVRSIEPAQWADLVFQHCAAAVAAAGPCLHEITLTGRRHSVSYLRLLLPLGSSDGDPTALLAYSRRPNGAHAALQAIETE